MKYKLSIILITLCAIPAFAFAQNAVNTLYPIYTGNAAKDQINAARAKADEAEFTLLDKAEAAANAKKVAQTSPTDQNKAAATDAVNANKAAVSDVVIASSKVIYIAHSVDYDANAVAKADPTDPNKATASGADITFQDVSAAYGNYSDPAITVTAFNAWTGYYDASAIAKADPTNQIKAATVVTTDAQSKAAWTSGVVTARNNANNQFDANEVAIAASAPVDTSVAGYQALSPITMPGGGGIDQSSFPAYLQSIYKIGIGLCFVLGVIMFTWAGIEYILSESVTNKADGRKRMENALIGLAIALASYILLQTINPALLTFTDIKNEVTNTDPNTSNVNWLNSLLPPLS